jgi:hypothetical protein
MNSNQALLIGYPDNPDILDLVSMPNSTIANDWRSIEEIRVPVILKNS